MTGNLSENCSVSQLKSLDVAALNRYVNELSHELLKKRIVIQSKEDNHASKDIRHIRKCIARVKTVVRMKELEEAKAKYNGKKWMPNQLKPKMTRALRRRLTPEQANKKVSRVQRKLNQFAPKTVVLLN